MLTALVNAGKLPSVEDRVPSDPMVVEPLVEKGQYGSDLRFGFVGTNAAWGGMLYLAGWEHPVTWKPDFNSIEPNVIKAWEVTEDATEYTFFLRKGMKWSDGAPYTADDIMFYLDDVLGDSDLFPNGRGADWLPGDMAKEFRAVRIDDYTVKLIFPKPYGTFMYQLATWAGRQFTQYPKHYLMQFHQKYNTKVDDLVAQDGTVKDWIGLFFKKGPDTWGDPQRFFENVDLPSMGPFIVKQPLGTGTTIILERNPYYWKVDPDGNQLPYIDRIVGTAFQDASSRTFAMLNGDLDWVKDVAEADREIYYDAVAAGKPIDILTNRPDGGNTQSIHFNMTVLDPIKNQIFNDKNFRIGMSYAIKRDEVIEVVFKGQGEPAQVGPLQGSPIYNEQLEKQYIEYDVTKANEYLDKVLPNKDKDGFRLGSDGKKLSIVFTVSSDLSYGAAWVQVAEMLIGYWKAVGVDVQLDAVTDAVFGERRNKNDIEMTMYHGGEGGAGMTAILDPRWHVPGEWFSMFGQAWILCGEFKEIQTCREDNEYGQPWPDYAWEVRQLYNQAIQQPTQEGQVKIMKQVMQKSADIFWTIGISRPGLGYQPINKRLHNIPDGYWGGWLEGVDKINRPEQWFIK